MIFEILNVGLEGWFGGFWCCGLGECGGVAGSEHADEVAPDFAPFGLFERGIVDCELDAGFECFVEGSDAVGG